MKPYSYSREALGEVGPHGNSIGEDILSKAMAHNLKPPIEDPRPPIFSDESLALRFTDRHGGELRYVAAWGRWLRWDGTRWLFDNTLYAYDLARKICREAAAECNKEKVARAIAAAKTVAAIEHLAKADRRHAATVDQWDAD